MQQKIQLILQLFWEKLTKFSVSQKTDFASLYSIVGILKHSIWGPLDPIFEKDWNISTIPAEYQWQKQYSLQPSTSDETSHI
jgi:hypothetical protein